MPKVYNKYHGDAPKDAVYIGSGSPWGNQWSHLESTNAKYKVDTREDAIACYIEWIMEYPRFLERVRKELAGKDLVCFCKPKACHGDILLAIANNYAMKFPIRKKDND